MSNFLIYKSSAGSGKTYTLVREYLKLALAAGGDYRRILAVTFTNKSAEEMKIRIIEGLIALSKGEAENLRLELAEEGIAGDISARASQVLKDILHKYSHFSVLTIDSFFHRIIRSFARELRLQLGYTIEIDDDIVLERITEELLDEVGSNPELTEYIEDYVFYRIDENKGWKIDVQIKQLAGEIFKERFWIKRGGIVSFSGSREKIRDFIKILFAIINRFEKQMCEYAAGSVEILNKYGLTPADFKNGTFSYFIKILNNDKDTERFEPGKIVRKIICGQDTWYSQKSFKKQLINQAAEAGLDQNLKDAIRFYDEHARQYISARELVKTIHVLGIYKDLMDRLREYRDENKLMLISDTNNILMKVISGDNSPFIYEKTGSFYRNFLIDEFQDTSTFQWKNFLPLIQNSLSEGNFSMIVGDVKQSIYRWRNGNMRLLLEEARSDLAEFDELIKEQYLNENYRSCREIVEFNNIFFKSSSAWLSQKIGDDSGLIINSYSDAAQDYSNCGAGGYVNIKFIKAQQEEQVFELSMDETVRALTSALESGYRQKDIMILTRYNREGSETAQYLINAGYKVVSNESLLLLNSPKVKLVLNLLKYIADNRNNLAKTELLYNYLIYSKNAEAEPGNIFTDCRRIDSSIFISELPGEFFSDETRTKLKPAFYRLSLYELVETLIRIFRLNDSMDAYLLRFLDAVIEFSALNSSDITAFLEWWYQTSEKHSIVVPEQEDAVRVMTIHKAKGLQSPVVILPYTNWDMGFSSNDLIWVSGDEEPFSKTDSFLIGPNKLLKQSCFEKDYSEELVMTNLDNLNLLYVAFTRAKDRLHVIVAPKAHNNYHAGKLVFDAITSEPVLSTNFISENEFETGIKSSNTNSSGISEALYKPCNMLSSEYHSKIVIKPLSKEFSIEQRKKFSEMRNRGILIHKALSMIKYPGDAEKAFEHLKSEGLITDENEDAFISELLEILKNKEVKAWFSGEFEIKTETEIILPGGKIYKPDRVLIKNQKAIVVDYKTGKYKKQDSLQVTQYADTLQQMGYAEVEKYLFYIPEGKVATV